MLNKIVIEKLTTSKMIELYDSKGVSPEQIEEIAKTQNKKINIPADFYTKFRKNMKKL